MVGLVLPDSILEILVVSIFPSILPTKSTWDNPLDSLAFLILAPIIFSKSDFSILDIFDKSNKILFLQDVNVIYDNSKQYKPNQKNMKNLITLLLFLSISFVGYSQNKYSTGYSDGYKQGYCYEDFNCIPPISPITPIPRINESSTSYRDGYNRGFEDGRNKKRENEPTTPRKRYETSSPKFLDNTMYQPNFELAKEALKIKQRQYEQKMLEWKMSESEREENFKNQLTIAIQNFNNKNYQTALNYCQSALSNGFHNAEVYYIMGLSKYELADYDYAIIYLQKAKDLKHPRAQRHLDILKEEEKNMKFQTNFPKFGIRAGYNKNDLKSSFVIGLWGQNSNIFGVKDFCWIPEFNYFKNEYIDYRYDNGTYDTDEISNIQMNLLLFKNRIVRRLDVVYGVGGTVGFTRVQDFVFSCDANGGLRGYITHKLFLDARVFKSVVTSGGENEIKNTSLNMQLALGFGF